MANVYPSLSSMGWVTDVSVKADKILMDFITANYSQSIIFRGKIKSLAYCIHKARDMAALQENLQLIVTALLSGYYDNAEVSVRIVPLEKNGAVDNVDNMDIRISAIVTENGIRYSLGKLVQYVNSAISKITAL